MTHRFAEIAFTPAVRAVQAEMGSARAYDRHLDPEAPANDRFGPAEAQFIAARDSFYLASVGETGWPYVQHRGGPRGFLKLLDERTLAFADYRGNRQYVSVGNVGGDDRVSLFLMDYPNRRRLKLLGRARLTSDPEVISAVMDATYQARPERAWLITLEGFDWNCPQHITPRFTEDEVVEAVKPLHLRIAALEAEVERLRNGPSASDV